MARIAAHPQRVRGARFSGSGRRGVQVPPGPHVGRRARRFLLVGRSFGNEGAPAEQASVRTGIRALRRFGVLPRQRQSGGACARRPALRTSRSPRARSAVRRVSGVLRPGLGGPSGRGSTIPRRYCRSEADEHAHAPHGGVHHICTGERIPACARTAGRARGYREPGGDPQGVECRERPAPA